MQALVFALPRDPQIALFVIVPAITASRTLYHWAMPGYLFLLPLLGDWLALEASRGAAWVKRAAVLSVSITVCLVSLVVLAWYVPITFGRDPLLDMRSPGDINTYLEAKGLLRRDDVLVAPTKWHSAAKFDYALKQNSRVTCFGNDPREYGIIAPLEQFAGKDFIIPVPIKNAQNSEITFSPLFDQFTRLDNLVIHQGSLRLDEFAIFYGRSLRKASP